MAGRLPGRALAQLSRGGRSRLFATAPAASSSYANDMYAAWSRDPASVHPDWDAHFKGGGAAVSTDSPALSTSVTVAGQGVKETMGLLSLVTGYQTRGHNMADLDPLGIQDADIEVGKHPELWGTGDSTPPELDPATYGYTEADMDREFEFGTEGISAGFLSTGKVKLRDLIDKLKTTYCGTVGIEYMHLQDREQLNWIRERAERTPMFEYGTEEKEVMMTRLMESHMFETFLGTKFANDKRFGLEGCESLIPAMLHMIDRSAALGVEQVVVGMPHRGRLNVLANVLEKPLEMIFKEFAGQSASDEGSGDVKYHLGTSTDYTAKNGENVHISLMANPSHLEAVNPLVSGKTRALSRQSATEKSGASKTATKAERKQRFARAMSIVLHGDAAFAGQGVVYESFAFSQLPAYETGGSIHIVVNNQIGFTTDPKASRSTAYCTDIGRAFDAPIFHVNGDDVEAVTYVAALAAEWRERFSTDVIIDIVCYRRHGHNEQDQPMFTQPEMYRAIATHKPAKELYCAKLVAEGTFTQEKVDAVEADILKQYEDAFTNAPAYEEKPKDWLESRWKGFKKRSQTATQSVTGVSQETLETIGLATASVPDDFTVHRSLARILKQRAKTVTDGAGIDFGTAEALAFGSLLIDGVHVRFSGQDVERGTFSHRHAVLHDQKTEATHTPLKHLAENQAAFTISNSHLSEFAVLGFELGYSLNSPQQLVMWEAQFGDFANTAQCIIDQFISSGEDKWMRQSGLVMLLPHGYEGMGPEHSSARLERFLQMADDDPYFFPEINPGTGKQIQSLNWQVVNCTTPANYFHVLRRQIYRDFRKPLICMTGKSTLRLRDACSDIKDMTEGTRFKRVIPEGEGPSAAEELLPADQVERHVFCSGKVYYDLQRARAINGLTNVAITRVEQLCPFPFDLVKEEQRRFPNAEVIWCQEEQKNMGGWGYVRPRMETASKGIDGTDAAIRPRYTGRGTAASTATGFKYTHISELHAFLADALVGDATAEVESVDGGFPIWKK